ncbi:RNA polymerase sigma factor [Urbifossiella limnaea]|uniref:RNA polymerase sigma factor n=1 Tax=Urbifossiella limnaea TaxID=2528023 RepID=A0A517XTT6_9BACT|nr:sigma-70 family RNA polymerase sigma factor [Urbifossiella limnaea]QDU20929.1 RNA polymerase sigma factor [Urbifossiella limnaea]
MTPVGLADHAFRHEYGRLVAGLVRRLGPGRLDLAEDAVQSALLRAVQTWPRRGVPDDPAAWLRRAARNAAVDALRREATATDRRAAVAVSAAVVTEPDDSPVADESLRLLFTCCHPALTPESRVALALKVVCGFGVAEIARALLTTDAAVLKRVTRARDALAAARLSADPVPPGELAARRPAVLAVLYLVFNEGYHASHADALIRHDLCAEALRQTDALARHPDLGGPAAEALLALMLFHAARFPAREDDHGRLVLLEQQDRSLWDRDLLRAARTWLARSARGDELTTFHLEAAIAAEHCAAATFAATDWRRIVELYDRLCGRDPGWLHALNRAIAVAHLHGPQAGLRGLLAVRCDGAERYSHWHAALGELHRRCGDAAAARLHFAEALALAGNDREREFLRAKRDDC